MLIMSANLWDERFRQEAYVYGEAPNLFLTEQVRRLRPGSKVLCLAEGEGRNAVYLAGLGFEVTAVDGSEVAIAKARRLAEKRGVVLETIVSDLRDFEPSSSSWDAVIAIWCHLPSGLRPTVHHRIARGLRKGGVLILEHDHPAQAIDASGRRTDAEVLMNLDELRGSFSKLEPQHTFEGAREVREGLAHAGQRFVTQFVAAKTHR